MSTSNEPPGDQLVLGDSPVRLTRREWAMDARQGLAHRIAGKRFVIRLDRGRGTRIICPVILVEDPLST